MKGDRWYRFYDGVMCGNCEFRNWKVDCFQKIMKYNIGYRFSLQCFIYIFVKYKYRK